MGKLQDETIKKWAVFNIMSNDPEAVKDAKALAITCANLIKREEKLRKALEFYANEDNHLAVPEGQKIYAEDEDEEDMTDVYTCYYWWVYSTGNPTDTAKQALQQQTEEKDDD